MDFLDPKAKRRHTIRLFIGYGLMAILIGIASFIILFRAYGFDVDRQTGEVIQNGLVFVDSAPDGAAILFNGQEQRERTNNRFELPAGQYELKIRKDNYRDWQRNFALNGGEIERFTYPMLILNDLKRAELAALETAPSFVTQSPDRRWAIMSQGSSLTALREYDLNSLNENVPQAREFSVSGDLFTQAAGNHSLEMVEWSTDNKHVLVKHTFTGGNEFVIISRDQPETSFNINKLLGQNPTNVVLRDKKFDQWYVYNQEGGTLQTAGIENNAVKILDGVTAFKTHDAETILYSQMLPDGKTQRVTIKDGKDSYTLKETVSPSVMLDIAKYDGAWHMVVGSYAEGRTFIYRDPLPILKRRDGTNPPARSVLKTTGPMTQIGFSQNTRFIFTQSGQHFEVYDAEYNRNYKFDISNVFDPNTKVLWMDGHRLLGRSQNKAVIFDFDGSNKQELLTSLPNAPVIFDRDYTVLYNVDNSPTVAGKFGFYAAELRLEEDK